MNHNATDHTCHGMSYSGLALTFLAGGVAGATAALLLAPRSGQATREMMGRKLNDTADSALAMKGRVVNTLNHAADSARELKNRAFRKGKDIREEAADRVEAAASALAGNGART